MGPAGSIELRPFSKLGRTDHGFMKMNYHFSFSDYYNPQRMNWGALRVWNDDVVKSDGHLPFHPHRSMEIITYILPERMHPLTGKLEGGIGASHRDSLGSAGITKPGDVQVMSVGSDGILHAEDSEDPSSDKSVALFQIWILPSRPKKESDWGTRHFPRGDRAGKFVALASGFKEDQPDALLINSDSRVLGASVKKGETVSYKLGANRLGYLVSAGGSVTVNGLTLGSHDGAAIKETDELHVTGVDETAEVILVDTYPI